MIESFLKARKETRRTLAAYLTGDTVTQEKLIEEFINEEPPKGKELIADTAGFVVGLYDFMQVGSTANELEITVPKKEHKLRI